MWVEVLKETVVKLAEVKVEDIAVPMDTL